jgi:hypothetical protein
VLRATLALFVLSACRDPGTIWSPMGTTPLRTALYRVGPRQGLDELVLLLSNGELTCGLPGLTDAEAQSDAIEVLYTAACREGAQHVVLRLYSWDGDWLGQFPGAASASPDLLSSARREVAGGSFYAVQEAILVNVEGLGRYYAAAESLYLPDLGEGGEIMVEKMDEQALTGWFSFPDDELSGEFRAERCEGDTSLLDVVEPDLVHFCG